VDAEIVFLRDKVATVPVPLPPLPLIRTRLLELGCEILQAHIASDFPKKPSSATICQRLQCGFVDRCWGRQNKQYAVA